MAAIIFNVLPLIPYLSVFISFPFLWVGRQGFSLLRTRTLRRLRVYSAPRPDGFEPVHRQQKSDQPELIAFYSMVGRQGFEPWTLGLKVPCSAS